MQMSTQANFFSYRPLLYAWIVRTIRARYKQSFLGGLWAVVQPTVATLIFSLVFTYFVPIDTNGIPYAIFVYTAMAPWTFFTTSLMDMVESLVINMNLVSKIYFPREILPMAALLARLLDFGIASLLLVAMMFYYGIAVNPVALLFLPAVIAIQMALTLGLGFIGAALNVFYRDVKHLVTLVIQVWLYASPIIYPVERVPEWLRPYYFINPMAGIIQSYREILLNRQTPGNYLFVSLAIAAVILWLGYRFFKRVEFQFADVV
jgi:lipopolysaccharide transport system permease protein